MYIFIFIVWLKCLILFCVDKQFFIWNKTSFCKPYSIKFHMAHLTDDDEFMNVLADTLARHNVYRKKHNAAPLKINSKKYVHILNSEKRELCIRLGFLKLGMKLDKLNTVGDYLVVPKLNEISQKWADELAQKDTALHRPNNTYGENIFIIKSSNKVTDLGVRAVDYWYSEIDFFNFQGTDEDMSTALKALHFTQVVWKNSKELGIGASKSLKSGKIYLVCNYDPRGNIVSEFKNNVFPSVS